VENLNREFKIALQATTLLFAETVVTATRHSTVRAEAPAATALVEIGSPQTVARQNIGEALSQAQSVFVKEYGSVSGLKTINLRGAGDGQTLVLTDGVRLNNPQNGGVDASLLSLLGLERIEVVRGNASALYGSDAMGGVIHLRSSPAPAGFSGAVQTSGGSFGTFNTRAQLGYGTRIGGTVARTVWSATAIFPSTTPET
jgi:outer membrane cobalamin receptor